MTYRISELNYIFHRLTFLTPHRPFDLEIYHIIENNKYVSYCKLSDEKLIFDVHLVLGWFVGESVGYLDCVGHVKFEMRFLRRSGSAVVVHNLIMPIVNTAETHYRSDHELFPNL